MTERYIIRYGKFGAYFYDLDIKKEMTLKEVKTILDIYYNKLKNIGVDV